MCDFKNFNLTIRSTRTQDYLASVLGNRKDSFVTNLIAVVAGSEQLQQCEPMSLMYTAMKATTLNLPIDQSLGYAAMIPYKEKGAKNATCQFQIMRDGWIELLQRTGQVKFIANEVVHEGELVKKNKFTGEYIFDEEQKTSDTVIGYMAYVRLVNGFEKTVYWSKEECEAHARKYSKTYSKGYGLWKDNFDAMALKTVLKHLIKKYMPKSTLLQDAIQSDQATIGEDMKVQQYIDAPEKENTKDYTEYTDLSVDEKKELMRQNTNQAPELP